MTEQIITHEREDSELLNTINWADMSSTIESQEQAINLLINTLQEISNILLGVHLEVEDNYELLDIIRKITKILAELAVKS